MKIQLQQHNKMDCGSSGDGEDASESYLLQLPVEIRAKIIEKLDSKSLLQTRQTCSVLKILIDQYIGVDAYVSEMCLSPVNLQDQFDFFARTALRDICIIIMNSTPKSILFCDTDLQIGAGWSFWVNHSSFQDLFLYPEYIQRVTVKCEISVWLLHEIMKNCFNLRMLKLGPISRISGNPPHIESLYSHHRESQKFYYRKLKTLIMSNIDLIEKKAACINSMRILKSIQSSCLEKFRFESWPADSSEDFCNLIESLKSFMLHHHDTLKTVHLIFRLTTIMQNISTLEEFSGRLTKYIMDIADSSNIEVFGLAVYSRIDWIWKPLLTNQRKLKTVQLTTLWTATTSNFTDCFRKSFATLTTLCLQVHLPLHNTLFFPLDFTGLDQCVNLKEFNVTNKAINIRSVHNFQPLVSNLTSLPNGLETFVLSYIVLETEDILHLLESLCKLKNLVLLNSVLTRFSSFGVEDRCLQEILKKRGLESLLISGLNIAYKKLERIVNALRSPQEPLYRYYMSGETGYNPLSSDYFESKISYDLEIICEETFPFTWRKEPLDCPTFGNFYTLTRKIPYLGTCE